MNPTDTTNTNSDLTDLIHKLIFVVTRNVLESKYSPSSCIAFERLCKSNTEARNMCLMSGNYQLITKCNKKYDKVKKEIFPGIRNVINESRVFTSMNIYVYNPATLHITSQDFIDISKDELRMPLHLRPYEQQKYISKELIESNSLKISIDHPGDRKYVSITDDYLMDNMTGVENVEEFLNSNVPINKLEVLIIDPSINEIDVKYDTRNINPVKIHLSKRLEFPDLDINDHVQIVLTDDSRVDSIGKVKEIHAIRNSRGLTGEKGVMVEFDDGEKIGYLLQSLKKVSE